MHKSFFFLLVFLPLLAWGQKPQTHPYFGVGGHISTLLGRGIETTPQPGAQAILGMWAFGEKRTEWKTEVSYTLVRGSVEGYQIENQALADSGNYGFLAHTLRWTTLIVWHASPRKEGLNLQGGGYFGVGAGGRGDQTDVRYGEDRIFVMQDLYASGTPHVGILLGVGLGNRQFQGSIHGVWDSRTYSRIPGLPVRRPMIQASISIILQDFVIF